MGIGQFGGLGGAGHSNPVSAMVVVPTATAELVVPTAALPGFESNMKDERGFPIRIHYTPDCVSVHSLKSEGLEGELATALKEWVMTMTPDKDDESGPDFRNPSTGQTEKGFWTWINEHIENFRANPDQHRHHDVYVLRDVGTKAVIAVVGVVDDDRGVSQQLDDAGQPFGPSWVGGLNVHRDYRTHQVGLLFGRMLLAELQGIADRLGEPFKVHAFTTGRKARIYGRYGFEDAGKVEIREFTSEPNVVRRVFNPQQLA